MITKYGADVKRFIYEMANWYKAYGVTWQVEQIDRFVELLEMGMITHRECARGITRTIDEQGPHYRFKDLDPDAQKVCVDEYLSVVCPYDPTGDLDGATFEEIGETIDYTIGSQFWVDKSGHWWDEGRMMAR